MTEENDSPGSAQRSERPRPVEAATDADPGVSGSATTIALAVLRGLLAALVCLFLLRWSLVAAAALWYPYELEWLEGALLLQVHRILAGLPLYTEPSLDYAPLLYSPLYAQVCAAVAALTGPGFFALRLVSVLSTVGCFFVIGAMVRRETGSAILGLVSAGLFAACYEIGDRWFELGRVDMLFLFFLLAAVYALRFGSTASEQVAAGLFLFLSFLTKQSAALAAVPLIAWSAGFGRGKTRWLFGGTFLILCAGATLAAHYASGGWCSFYLALAGKHELLPERFLSFWTEDLWYYLRVSCIFSLVGLVLLFLQGRVREAFYWLAVLAGAIALSWLSRLHRGGRPNVVLPAYAALALLTGLAVDWIRSLRPGTRTLRTAGEALLLSACAAQFVWLLPSPFFHLARAKKPAVVESWIRRIAVCEGEVFIPYHGYLARLAGKREHAHGAALVDILRARGQHPAQQQLLADLRKAVGERRFSLIVLDRFPRPSLPTDLRVYCGQELAEHYARAPGPETSSTAAAPADRDYEWDVYTLRQPARVRAGQTPSSPGRTSRIPSQGTR